MNTTVNFSVRIENGMVMGFNFDSNGNNLSPVDKEVCDRILHAITAVAHMPRATDCNEHIDKWNMTDDGKDGNWDEEWDDEWIPKK